MLARFLKRLIGWTILSVPVGMAVGALFSAYFGEDAALDRLTSAVNGALAGASISLIGAWMAAATTAIAHDPLKRAGGSELLTGAIVSYGLLVVALGLLYLLG